MSILHELPQIVKRAGEECDRLLRCAEEEIAKKKKTEVSFFAEAAAGTGTVSSSDEPEEGSRSFPVSDESEDCSGRFFLCDNARFLAKKIADGSLVQAVDLIYIDPPFYSQTEQGVRIEIKSPICDAKVVGRLSAYSDIWENDRSSYLEMIAVRLMLMKETLKPTGSIFVHLDWHAVHAVKLIMDEIFGEQNFINEIIWTYKSGGSASRHYSRKHDTILFYSRTRQYKFRLQKEKSYNRGLKPYRFKGVEEFQDDIGWYTMVNQKDVWNIDMVGRSSGERLSYATQKPEALLARIIDAVTDEGDLTADFFCGSGTLAAVAAQKNRRFVCTDISSLAVANALKRPLQAGYPVCLSLLSSSPEICDRPAALDSVSSAAAGGVFRASDAAVRGSKKRENRIEAVSRDGTFELQNYIPNFQNPALRIKEENDRKNWRKIVKQDPLSLIDYWGVGTLTKKGEFFPKAVSFRKKDGSLNRELHLDIISEVTVPSAEEDRRCVKRDEKRKLFIFAADIFGNIVFSEPAE